ncbi:transcription termination factor MTERF4, chloroplastic [Cryptomeria japonica]|uniref:transcription termination factor MTERF4, chloroplastic n=1 Tax=Cryptomeria japonica TaxID=3369 RepID=UPI0027D9F9F8|nr:transcription termination factor MTERF4, chloroplastic [Cryptomeria japonica]
MNTMLCVKLFVVAVSPVTSNLCWKLFAIHTFHFRNVFTSEAHSQTLFSQFASTKLKPSEAEITRIFKSQSHLQKLQTPHKVEQFIHSFKKRGFNEVQISKILRNQPGVIELAETKLEAAIKLLEYFGVVDRNLTRFLTINSRILRFSAKNLLSKMEFLKNVFQSHDVLVKALLRTRTSRLFSSSLEKTMKPSLAYWKGWGFSETELLSLLESFPDLLSRMSLTPGQVDLINKIGAEKESKMFKYVVGKVAMSRVETLEAKIENLKLCGLSAEETWQVLGAVPLILCFSKKNVSEKMNFLVNNMELSANYVVKYPKFLQISLEKTMRPRFLVWQKIKSIDALNLSIYTLLRMSETRFVDRIIKEHPESETLWRIYENAISNASNNTKSSTKHNLG